MSFFVRYPASAASVNLSVGLNGDPAPTSSTEIGGINPGGDLTPVAVDNAGQVKVIIDDSNPVDANVAQWGGVSTSLGQKAMAASVPVVISSDQSAVSVSGPLTDTQLRATPVPISGTVAATQSGTWNITNISGTVSLPTGAATDAAVVANGVLIGAVNETAPASDTANSGLNGRLQRIAQRLTSLIALFPSSIGQKTKTGSLSVTLASDQGSLPITPAVNTNGNIVNTSLTATTASSASAPANAVGFILEAPSDNTNNVRWCIGGTASASVGMLTEPGRDSGYVPCAATISVCATVSGTNAYSIQWILSS